VLEVARQRGLCTATVYGLCARGELAHVRILNAIRVAPADLDAFVAARRNGVSGLTLGGDPVVN
jgi:helix-turn-helix protein